MKNSSFGSVLCVAVVVATSFFFALPRAARAQRFEVTRIPSATGYSGFSPGAIDNASTVYGSAHDGPWYAPTRSVAAAWRTPLSAAIDVDLTPPSGSRLSGITAANERGQAVGFASFSGEPLDAAQFSLDGTSRLMRIPGSVLHTANDINDWGLVAGGHGDPGGRIDTGGVGAITTPPRMDAMVWYQGVGYPLTAPAGSTISMAYAVNNHGWVVGTTGDDDVARAWAWAPGGAPVDLSPLLPTTAVYCEARDITESNVVLARCFHRNLHGVPGLQAIRSYVIAAGAAREVPYIPVAHASPFGDADVDLHKINELGCAAGEGTDADRNTVGLFYCGGRTQVLSTLVSEEGWAITQINDINDRNEMVGIGSFRGGEPVGILLQPM